MMNGKRVGSVGQESSAGRRKQTPKELGGSSKPLSIIGTLFGECICGPIAPADFKGLSSNAQFIELHGIQSIGLGAITDELSARERVYDTLEQLASRTERMISIGYLLDDDRHPHRKKTETIPLDIWTKAYPSDQTMSNQTKQTIANIKTKKFEEAFADFQKTYEAQKNRLTRNNNRFLLGITAHNMGVVCVLAGQEEKAMPLFEEALALKRKAFGRKHPECAISLDELGIQLFARERYDEALTAFEESQKILSKWYGAKHPRLAMLMNNIACCAFQVDSTVTALMTMNEAMELQKEHNESPAKNDLDLLYMATLLSNYGYLQVRMKQYDEARGCFEDALLIQQSVLGDAHDHRAISDSRKNLEFTNAFHS